MVVWHCIKKIKIKAATMICHPLLIISVLKVTLLASTNLSIIAAFVAGLSLSPSWAVAGSILS